jgi:hypothetical protein
MLAETYPVIFDSSNDVLGETYTHPLPKKVNQTFVLLETNCVLHRKQNAGVRRHAQAY